MDIFFIDMKIDYLKSDCDQSMQKGSDFKCSVNYLTKDYDLMHLETQIDSSFFNLIGKCRF